VLIGRSVRLNRLSTPNINQRLSSTLLGIACLMVYSLLLPRFALPVMRGVAPLGAEGETSYCIRSKKNSVHSPSGAVLLADGVYLCALASLCTPGVIPVTLTPGPPVQRERSNMLTSILQPKVIQYILGYWAVGEQGSHGLYI